MRRQWIWLTLVLLAVVAWSRTRPGPADWTGTLSSDGSIAIRLSGQAELWMTLAVSTLSDERDLFGSWRQSTATKDYPSSSIYTNQLACFQDGTFVYEEIQEQRISWAGEMPPRYSTEVVLEKRGTWTKDGDEVLFYLQETPGSLPG